MSRTDLRTVWTWRGIARSVVCALTLVLVAGLLAPRANAQQLRNAAWSADLIVVARVVSVQPLGNEMFLHKLRPERTLKGEAPEQITVVETKGVSDRPKPTLGPARIYCLRPARNLELPERHGPFFKMLGLAGDNPVAEVPESVPEEERAAATARVRTSIELVEFVVASERGISPRVAGQTLHNLALSGTGPSKTEAVQLLRERTVVRDALNAVQRSALLTRASAEDEDLDYKIALASLCAELRMSGVVESLCLSLESKPDTRVAKTLGRLAKFLHGEQAVEAIRPFYLQARKSEVRNAMLLAIGATETESALEAILRIKDLNGDSAAVDAALRAHGTARALDAVSDRKK